MLTKVQPDPPGQRKAAFKVLLTISNHQAWIFLFGFLHINGNLDSKTVLLYLRYCAIWKRIVCEMHIHTCSLK